MSVAKDLIIKQLRETIAVIEREDFSLRELERFKLRWRSINFENELMERLISIEKKINGKPPYIVDCPLIKKVQNESAVELITGLEGNFDSDKKNIFDWLSGTEELIICDPYFYSFDKPKKNFKSIDNYIEFQKELLPKKLKKLEIFHFEGPNRKILKKFLNIVRVETFILEILSPAKYMTEL